MRQCAPRSILVAVDFGHASELVVRGSPVQALAAGFGRQVSEKAVASLDDLRCDPQASMMIVATGRYHGGSWFGDTAERLVRNGALPMLFLPSRG